MLSSDGGSSRSHRASACQNEVVSSSVLPLWWGMRPLPWNPLEIVALLRSCEVQALLMLIALDLPDIQRPLQAARKLEDLLDRLARHDGLTRAEQTKLVQAATKLHRARLAERDGSYYRMGRAGRRVLRIIGCRARTNEEIHAWVETMRAEVRDAPKRSPEDGWSA